VHVIRKKEGREGEEEKKRKKTGNDRVQGTSMLMQGGKAPFVYAFQLFAKKHKQRVKSKISFYNIKNKFMNK
jgi:hypothetical protein